MRITSKAGHDPASHSVSRAGLHPAVVQFGWLAIGGAQKVKRGLSAPRGDWIPMCLLM